MNIWSKTTAVLCVLIALMLAVHGWESMSAARDREVFWALERQRDKDAAELAEKYLGKFDAITDATARNTSEVTASVNAMREDLKTELRRRATPE